MKKRIICATLALTLAMTGCSLTGKTDSGSNTGASIDSTTEVTGDDSQTGSTVDDGSTSSTVDDSSTGSSEDVTEVSTQHKGEPIIDSEGNYLFNPYVGAGLLKDEYPQECWDALYNFIDALREGKDTFECPSQEAFDFCTNPAIWGEYFPVASLLITMDSCNEFNYQDGKGGIGYWIPKEEFLEKEKAFEADIESILKECVKSDYSDFEKAFYLYDYISKNFTYGHDMADGSVPDDETFERYGTYNCFVNRNGICSGLAPSYVYLLLQCGVDAIVVQSSDGAHAWAYVKIGNEYYYSDPTWGLRSENGDSLPLDYFLMSSEKRHESMSGDYGVYIFDVNAGEFASRNPFTETSDKFDFLRDTTFVSIDSDKDILTYTDKTGNNVEYKY
ncbi:hypothetical protein D6853_06615 [Butyrivibrio sp. X503]|uniref:transglutaminase domain-containing protein n=1 Tax=Butyrivibrio sp. X503 TaxID=2364878 RepID=UPI000EA9EA8C|nr:transglutaminase domain-containing protein [Butyrivibrio sp. X503]RKM56454.1 hypothetical protein D6853_06615 [Butyrivibrio sp. X503]